jgi:hypothetical protein
MPLVAVKNQIRSLSVPAETVVAIDRPVALRQEWNLCRLSALGAYRVVHLAGLAPAAPAAIAAVSLAGIAAALATDRFVCKTLLGEEFLIARSKNKILAAIPAF